MPNINRDAFFQTSMVQSFHDFDSYREKICHVATVLATILFFVIPQELPIALGWTKPRQNQGRLQTVVNGQIYQQSYFGGNTQCTIFINRKGNSILIYSPPKITSEFVDDVSSLTAGAATVKYIIVPNECHESFAEDAKKAFPTAKVITPKASKHLVEEAVHVDDTIENCLSDLEDEFGFMKMFRYDDNTRCTCERSYCIELFNSANNNNGVDDDCDEATIKDDDDDEGEGAKEKNNNKKKKYCLFVGQCGMGNYLNLSPRFVLSGFQSLFQPRGRYFRHYYYCFTTNHNAVYPYWTHLVQSIPGTLHAAIFLHGNPIIGPDTRDVLKKFYFYG